MMCCTALHCTALHYTALHCTALAQRSMQSMIYLLTDPNAC